MELQTICTEIKCSQCHTFVTNTMKHIRTIIFFFCLTLVGFSLSSQKIHTDQTLELLLDKSSKHVGVEKPRDLGFTGKDIKIAVIDTGVDYNHPDLFGFGPDGKVIGGYDFIENDDTPTDTNGHGTEVAGIIAANGGQVGIAPDAKILAYRVSDTGNSVSSDLIVKAIQRAIQDDADIINISLGVNRTNDRIEEAINYAVRKGITVVVAAGNSGPDLKTIGSPGRDPNAITVGATYNNITASLVATLDVDSKRVQVLPMVGIEPISESITSEIVFGKYGREDDLKGIDAKDKILLVERGSDQKDELIYFSQKERNSADAGAKALIVFNNEPGMFLGDLRNKQEAADYKPRIPTVSMSREDGLLLKSMLQNKTIGSINTFYHPDFVSFFSSRGPVSPFYIKPNLVAPGVFVNTTSINGGYNLTSGTSFAAPHVSGASAILLQKNPELKPHEIAAIITTTADPVSDTYGTDFPLETSGTGRLNVTRAFDANLIILPDYAVFDLSPFAKTKEAAFSLRTLNGQNPDIRVNFKFDSQVADFGYTVDGDTLKISVSAVEHVVGQHQGFMQVSDGGATYHIPILLRVADGSVEIVERGGNLDFAINSPGWSYAKITVFDGDAIQVDSISVTPTKKETIPIYESGQYWIQAEIKNGNNTLSLYNTATVKSPAPKQVVDLGALDLPERQILMVALAIGAIAAIGIAIRKR